LSRSFPIAGGREVVYVLDGQHQSSNQVSAEEAGMVGDVKSASR